MRTCHGAKLSFGLFDVLVYEFAETSIFIAGVICVFARVVGLCCVYV